MIRSDLLRSAEVGKSSGKSSSGQPLLDHREPRGVRGAIEFAGAGSPGGERVGLRFTSQTLAASESERRSDIALRNDLT